MLPGVCESMQACIVCHSARHMLAWCVVAVGIAGVAGTPRQQRWWVYIPHSINLPAQPSNADGASGTAGMVTRWGQRLVSTAHPAANLRVTQHIRHHTRHQDELTRYVIAHVQQVSVIMGCPWVEGTGWRKASKASWIAILVSLLSRPAQSNHSIATHSLRPRLALSPHYRSTTMADVSAARDQGPQKSQSSMLRKRGNSYYQQACEATGQQLK